jgi:predicted nucleic acid-binding protein
MYLLDTDVVWALRDAASGRADPALVAWAGSVAPASLFLSVITLMELDGGAARVERRDRAIGAALRTWIDNRVRPAFTGRVLPIDAAVTARFGRLGYSDQRDGLLAATALEHGTALVTRNTRAFRAGRVRTLNPWAYKPESGDISWEEGSLTGSLWLKSLFR